MRSKCVKKLNSNAPTLTPYTDKEFEDIVDLITFVLEQTKILGNKPKGE